MSAGIWVILTGPKSGCILVTLFAVTLTYSYIEVLWWCWCWYMGHTHRSQIWVQTGDSYDGLNAAIGVQHTEVPNQGASWSRFLAVTLMMVWVLEYGLTYRCQIWVQTGNAFWQLLFWWCEYWYMGHTYRSQIWVQTGDAFWRLLLWWCECWYMGHTYRSQIWG